ncbi:antA/AntB antirepressor family protein [Enterobacter kobei]|uniref:antA/AntB antirepressor family protein n=1 Tax=Enterobacter kobei TaxID=208224 RepID=UPI0039C8FC7D
MTTQLIPLFNGKICNETTLLCDARDLHAFLSVGKIFAAWIKDRIADYGFIENQDYVLLSNTGKQNSGRGGHNRKDYHLTLDTAKELAMVERNEKGRQIRRYFIECEKRLREKMDLTPIAHSYDSRTLCYKRNGITINEIPLRDEELVITLESWVQLAQNNGWIVMRQDDLIDKLVRGIESSLVRH